MNKIGFLFLVLIGIGFSQSRSMNVSTFNFTISSSSKTITASYIYSGLKFQTDANVSVNIKGVSFLTTTNNFYDSWPVNFKAPEAVTFPTQNAATIRGYWYENNN